LIPPHMMNGEDSPHRKADDVADRKLMLLKRAGLFGEDTKGATIRRAISGEDLRKAYSLVHRVFVKAGYVRPEPSGMRLRLFETTSETATFIAEKAGNVVGVLSVVGDSLDLGLPADEAFRPELDALRDTGVRLCELTNQAVAEEYRRSAVPTELMRCAVAHAMQSGFQGGVATISPCHRGFYDLMGFGQVGTERSYSQKLHDPVIALRLDFDRLRSPAAELSEAARFIQDFATDGNRYLSLVEGWATLARRHFLNADLLEQLFVHDRNFVAECTAQQLAILQCRWGQELFELVTGFRAANSLDPEGADFMPQYAMAPSTKATEHANIQELCFA